MVRRHVGVSQPQAAAAGGRAPANRRLSAAGRASVAVLVAAVLGVGLLPGGPAKGGAGADGGAEGIVFRMRDPQGDDHGPGHYRYPEDATFVPGLFDLTDFTVRTAADQVHFDLTFRAMVNPWEAPEGFHHQLVDIYIDTTPGQGRTEPLRPGPQVRFHPAHGWEVRIRAAPFGGTRLHWAHDPPDAPGQARGLRAAVLGDGRTLRVSVPKSLLGMPQPAWRYYVLVGGFDPFGADDYRAVGPTATQWRFGGDATGAGPRVIDLLAPRGWRSQARQLGSFAAPKDGPAVHALVHPVGPGRPGPALAGAGLAGVLAAGAAWRWRHLRRPRS